MNLLLIGTGTQGLAMARSLSQHGHSVFIVAQERGNYADVSRYVKSFFKLKKDLLSELSLEEIITIIKKCSIDTIIPMGDLAAIFLSKYKMRLTQFVKYLMPEYLTFIRGYDKSNLMELCEKYGFSHPMTQVNIRAVDDVVKEKLVFPLLIKPNQTCGGRGMTLVSDYEHLVKVLPTIVGKYGNCHLQQYIGAGGAQVEVQLFINEEKKLVYSSVIKKYRWYPESGGSSCCATCVENNKIVQTLYNLLLKLNWVGFADFDTIEDPSTGELLIMELNPRVPACVKTAMVSGVNWGEIIVNGYLGLPQNKYVLTLGNVVRHLGFELLWFVKSPNRWRTKPKWFNFINKHTYYQDMSDWSDPLPFIVGSFRNLWRLLIHKG